MAKIIGIIVVFASVLGGYVLSHGQIAALIQPFEVLIIGGACLGAFIQANPGYMTMHVFKKSLKMFGSRFTHAFYIEVLSLIYEILNKSRREGMMAIEADIEDAASSPIFAKYPGVLKDARMTAFICDYLRIMSSGNMAPHELEGLFDMELLSMKEELEHPSHAVQGIADGLPGFGIVAAVLGIVVTMASLGDGDKAAIGGHVGAALVGTFLGILAAYGFFGPLSQCLGHDAKEEMNTYEAIKASLVASASGMPPTLAVEFGRKVLYPAHRPSFTELEEAVRGR
ncbi:MULTISPECIES: flagellar motor stator protein MotA [unclassified Pseudomonas]|uniref:flagellar motor stator protein MotA n=1 Tax=unclassified Pseudomonas TaxID=196821 RepID=UPI000BCEFDBC|nr:MULTISPECIES: flagellar motor stator protein MotA [unclassified Pseudomonas]PVZ15465.1 chemotaxis protein MotA [Pseudomonas sp. URIL14HWK12:I12]PVZ24839.1 chemotaxis protein MotA [Pseudomonas sp. URIL14HWK12:I10]PVZ34685.1 chemotaxis protein MotA [Pseudomonas sp. URIL14HWK12:I11]SNZ08960.1 chemotaxis protein MotA [Pseudomonas sp. URIL14HWK12:I9]